MIVIFDPNHSNYANTFRDILWAKGYPCAICDTATIKSLAPMMVIVTETQYVDTLRSLPYDHVPVIAYGSGFVNSALNAVRVESMEELRRTLLLTLQRILFEGGMLTPSGGGIFASPGVYLSPNHIFVYGTRLDLPELSLRLLRCLIFSGSTPRSAEQLAAYCCGSDSKSEAGIRGQISLINRFASFKLPKPLVECQYGIGYRFSYFDEFSPAKNN